MMWADLAVEIYTDWTPQNVEENFDAGMFQSTNKEAFMAYWGNEDPETPGHPLHGTHMLWRAKSGLLTSDQRLEVRRFMSDWMAHLGTV